MEAHRPAAALWAHRECAAITTHGIKQAWTFDVCERKKYMPRVVLVRLAGRGDAGVLPRRADAAKDKPTLIFWIVSGRLSNKEVL